MAQPVTKWQGANGNLFDTEAEADQSLADYDTMIELTEWIRRHIDFNDYTNAQDVAIAVMRGFDIRPRASVVR